MKTAGRPESTNIVDDPFSALELLNLGMLGRAGDSWQPDELAGRDPATFNAWWAQQDATKERDVHYATNRRVIDPPIFFSGTGSSKMPSNSLYDGILMPQGGVYEPGPAVMLPPSAPAKQSAVVRALIASDPNGPGLRDPQSGMGGGWSQMQDFADSGSPSIPGPNGTIIAKDQTRLPGQVPAQFDPVEAYSGVPRNPGQQAIEAFAPRSAAFSPWGPDWTSGINAPGLVLSRSPVGAPHLTGVDPWANDRFGEPVAPRPGMVTGTPGVSPVAAALVAANARPITYSAPVAAGNFAQGSPNQSFEKQNGMGSVTNSMASSSRWNTGY